MVGPKLFTYFVYSSVYWFGEGNGTPLQYSCLENPMDGEPGRLQSMRLLRVRHDWATSLSLFTFMHWRRKWQPTPVFLPGESQGWEAWWTAICGVAELDKTEATWQQCILVNPKLLNFASRQQYQFLSEFPACWPALWILFCPSGFWASQVTQS